MYAIVEFKDGWICKLELLYIDYPYFHYRWENAYLIVPCKDVVKGVVPAEEYQDAQKAAKKAPIPKAPKPVKWEEVKV